MDLLELQSAGTVLHSTGMWPVTTSSEQHAAATPAAPDGWITDDGARVPKWFDVPLIGPTVALWPEGLDTDTHGLCDHDSDALLHLAGVLVAVAELMREGEEQ